MKPSHASTHLIVTFGSFFVLGAAAVVGCAQASRNGSTDADPSPAPTQATAPTEPADASTSTIPNTPPPSDPPPSSDAGASPDTGTAPPAPKPASACSLSPQSGCSTNETCDVVDRISGAVGCVPAGTGALGSHCAATSDCTAGLTCTHGACRPYCSTPGAACTGSGLGACAPLRDASGAVVSNMNVCSIACDLLDPAKACGTNSCTWDATLGTTDCVAGGTKDVDKTCATTADCKQGLACVTRPVYGSMCERWCRVGSSDDCTFPATCVNVFGKQAPTQGSDTLGQCE